MKGKGKLFEIGAIGYLRNEDYDVTETDILYPITSILSKDWESAKFELIRRISDKDIEKYGSDNIELIVRHFNSNVIFSPSVWTSSGQTTPIGTGITGYATTTGLYSGTSNVYLENPNATKITF